MKKFKFDIFKSFEIFTAETMSIIRDVVVNFVLIESENFFINKNHLSTHFKSNNNVQFNIYQNDKMYNMLTNSWNRKRAKVSNGNK